MDYINPFGAMGGLETIQSPFLRDMERGTRTNQAIPFLDMARQQQELEMQKKAMEYGEAASPLARQSREEKLRQGVMESQQTQRKLPIQTDVDIDEARRKLELSPYLTEQKKQEASLAGQKAAGTPAAELLQMIGAANTRIKELPESARPMAAQQIVDQIKARYPNAKLPPHLTSYNPEAWDMMSYAAIHSIEHQQKLAEQKAKDAAHMEREKEQTGRAIDVANIQAQSRVDAVNARGTGTDKPPKTAQEAFVRAYPIINNPDSSEEEKRQAAMSMLSWVNKEAVEIMKVSGLDPLRDGQKYSQALEAHKKRLYQQYGIDKYITPGSGGSPQPSLGKVTIKGSEYNVLERLPDGRIRIQDPKTGRTGTVKP